MRKFLLLFFIIAIVYCEFVENTPDSISSQLERIDTISVEESTYSDSSYSKGRVDLNDIFGSENDPTDWNYTEIDDEGWRYLDSIGVYWNSDSDCFMRK